jgi:hypothetical protein
LAGGSIFHFFQVPAFTISKCSLPASVRDSPPLNLLFLFPIDKYDASAILSVVNGIAVRCAVDRQKHDQPWTVFMGPADGVRTPVVWLLPNCLWAFPGGKGN